MAIEVNGSAVSNVNYNGNSMCGVIVKCDIAAENWTPYLRESYTTCMTPLTHRVQYSFWVNLNSCRLCYCYRFVNCSTNCPVAAKWDNNELCLNSLVTYALKPNRNDNTDWLPYIAICGCTGNCESTRCAVCLDYTCNVSIDTTSGAPNEYRTLCVGTTPWQYGYCPLPADVAACWYYLSYLTRCENSGIYCWRPETALYTMKCGVNAWAMISCPHTVGSSFTDCVCIG